MQMMGDVDTIMRLARERDEARALLDRAMVCTRCGSLLEARSSYKGMNRKASWCEACWPERPQSGSVVRVLDESYWAKEVRKNSRVSPPPTRVLRDEDHG